MNAMLKSLEATLTNEIESVRGAFQRIDWENPAQYGDWLWQTHYFVCHSTRLLALAASRLSTSQQQLHTRFLAHAFEEKGHEVLALKDYEGLLKSGFRLPEKYDESVATQLFYQSQYYWIEHQDPTSFFGYTLLLEVAAARMGPVLFQRNLKNFGEGCTRFLRVHAEEDPAHVEKTIKSLGQLSEAALKLVIRNLQLSSWSYQSLCREITSRSSTMLRLVA